MSNVIKAIAANYAISTVATCAIYGSRPDSINTYVYLLSDDESLKKKGKKYLIQNAALCGATFALQLATNKAITGHYIKIWK